MKSRRIIRIVGFTGVIMLGAFLIAYGGYDDSPGSQLLGLVAVIVGVVGVIKSAKAAPVEAAGAAGAAPRGAVRERTDAKAEHLARLREYLRNKQEITNDEAERLLGVSNATAERYLDELEGGGVLEQIGRTGKSVSYRKI